jgi:SOS-response transcriptional repressor LexA
MGQRKNSSLSERCKQLLEFIETYHSAKGFMPSYQDMRAAIGTTSRGGHLARIIKKLIEMGKLEREPGIARGLRLPVSPTPTLPVQAAPTSSYLSIPFLGKIAANNRKPIIHLNNYHRGTKVEVPTHLLPPNLDESALYVLQVEGDSMSAARIASGDYVVMQSCNFYREDDIVAIFLKRDEEVTLKMVKSTKRGNANLKPKSHKHHSRIENREDIEIQGRVVAVMRKYPPAARPS